MSGLGSDAEVLSRLRYAIEGHLLSKHVEQPAIERLSRSRIRIETLCLGQGYVRLELAEIDRDRLLEYKPIERSRVRAGRERPW